MPLTVLPQAERPPLGRHEPAFVSLLRMATIQEFSYDIPLIGSIAQWAKSPKKQYVGVYFLIYKNTLLQTVFLAIFPTGLQQVPYYAIP